MTYKTNIKKLIDRVYFSIEPLFKEPKKHLKTWLVILGVLVASWALVFFLNRPEPAQASWWNETWLYRRAIQVSNDNGQNLTDFQVAITLDTASLITAGKMQDDCDDLRVTDKGGNIIPHWIEENNPGCNDANTKIWTKVPTVYDGTDATTVYVYYGNAQANNAENGDNVFEFFDDFGGNQINTNKWDIVDPIGFSINSGELRGTNNTGRIKSVDTFSGPIIQEVKARTVTVATNGQTIGGFWDSSSDGFSFLNHPSTDYIRNNSSWTALSGERVPRSNVPYSISFVATASSVILTTTNLNTGAQIYQNTFTNTVSNESIMLGRRADNNTYGGGQSYDSYWDWIIVRQYAISEPTTSLDSEEISPSPVAYWKFDEGTGTTAYDSSGQGNDGTLGTGSSTPTWQTEDMCIGGKCLYFDGSSDYANTNTDFSWSTSDSFSISLWIKANSVSGNQGIIGKGAAGGYGNYNWEWSLKLSDSTLSFIYWNTSGSGILNLTSSESISANEWIYVYVTYSSTEKAKMYIENKLVATDTDISGTLQDRSTPVLIGHAYGSNGANYYFNGFIDEVKIYPYARTEEQIRSDYVAGASSKGSGAVFGHKAETAQITPIASKLIAHWKFNEGFGEDVHDSRGSNHGSFGVGGSAPTWTNEGKFGKALSFDGVDDYISTISPTGNLNPETGDFTISAWIYKPSDGKSAPGIISKNGNPGFKFNINSGNRLLLAIYDGSWHNFLSNTDVIEMDKWQHVAVAADRDSNANFFVNGESAGSQDISSMSSVNLSNSSSLRIGDDNWCRSYYCGQYDGKIDEVKIYNAALTQEEILQDYNQGVAAVMGQSSTNTGSTAPGGSASQEYCVPGSTDTCRPPVAEWDFEEGSGDTVYDKSGNGNDGAWSGSGSHWGTGKIGKAGAFNGSDARVSVGNDETLQINGGMTIGAWIKPNEDAITGWVRPIFDKMYIAASKTSGYALYISSGNIYLAYGDGTTGESLSTSDLSWNTARWYHIMATHDGNNTVKIYRDGVLVAEKNDAVGPVLDNGDYAGIIGRRVGSSYTYFDGLIDNIRIYDYARTPAQIAWDYNRGAPVGHWKFNECQGTIAHDSSGNENHGTINIGASAPQITGGTCSAPTDGTGAWYNGREGKINSAMSFDGVDDYIISQNTNISEQNNGVTSSAWVFISSPINSETDLISHGGGNWSPYCYWKLGLNSSGRIQLRTGWWSGVGGDGFVLANSSNDMVPLNRWFMITGIINYDFSSNLTLLKIYINGKIITNEQHIGKYLYNITDRPFVIGARTQSIYPANPPQNYFTGLMDDVRIYNYALTNEQINTLYNNGAVRFGN
ncbi:MAG: DUF2341 domain-containing protein [Patescibacteria group bacterium]|jgi:hypothetical protein